MARLFGRTSELSRLTGLLESTRSGRPTGALIVGDPGIGKTSMLDAVVGTIRTIPVVRARGYELEQSVALSATRDLVVDLVPSDGLGMDLGLEPVRLFEMIHRQLQASRGAVLVIGGLQWFDELSLALLHYVVRGARRGPHRLSVLLASRPSETATRVEASLARILEPPSMFVSWTVGPLDVDDGIALVRDIDPGCDSQEALALHQRAQGNPFWLHALTSAPDAAAPGRGLVDRLRPLGSDPSALLALLTLADSPLPADEVPALLDWPAPRAGEALARLAAAGLAVETQGSYRLAHDLVREAAVSEIPQGLARRFHRALAEWLEGDDTPSSLLTALEHRRAAGEPGISVALRIATSPQRRLIGEAGLQRLVAAADAAPRANETLALQRAVARLAAELGDDHSALERWSLVAARSPDPLERAEAAVGAARAAVSIGAADDAERWLLAAEASSHIDPCLEIEWRAQQASAVRWLHHRTDEARAASQHAVRAVQTLLAAGAGAAALDDRTRTACLDALATGSDAAMLDEDPAGMRAIAQQMTEVARGGNDEAYLRALLRVAMAEMHLDPASAVTRCRHVWDEARRLVLPAVMLDAGYFLAATLRTTGELTEAELVAGEAVELGRRVGDLSRIRHPVRVMAALVAISRGGWQDALARLDAEVSETPDPHYRLSLHQHIAHWTARIARDKSADVAASVRDHVAAALEDAVLADCPRCLGELRLRAAEALLRVGDVDDAASLIDLWDRSHLDPDRYWTLARSWVGALAQNPPDTDAQVTLEAAVHGADGLHLGLDGLWLRLDLATRLRPVAPERAAAMLTEAVQRAQRAGAATEAGIAEQELRALGVRTWRRSRTARPVEPADGLSGRELQVARLAASGATNPEIAAALFLSRRTVERHMSNVLAKLGLRNRAELAAWVFEQRSATP